MTAGWWTRLPPMRTVVVFPLHVPLHQGGGTEWKQLRWGIQERVLGRYFPQPPQGSQNARSSGVCSPLHWQPVALGKALEKRGPCLHLGLQVASEVGNPLLQLHSWETDQPGVGGPQRSPVDPAARPKKTPRSESLCMSHLCVLNPKKTQKKQRSLGNVVLWAAHLPLGCNSATMLAHLCQLARLLSPAHLHPRLLREWRQAFLYWNPTLAFPQYGLHCGEMASHPKVPVRYTEWLNTPLCRLSHIIRDDQKQRHGEWPLVNFIYSISTQWV